MLKQLTQYFHDCYQADFRAINLLDFFGKKVEHQYFLEHSDLLQGELLNAPLDAEWAQEIIQQLLIYSKEKDLYCCAFFMAGRTTIAGRAQPILAPLLLYPAHVEGEQGDYSLRIEIDKPVINPALLNAASTVNSGLYEQLLQELPAGFIKEAQLQQIQTVLSDKLPAIDLKALKEYPNLLSEAAIKKVRKSSKDGFVLLPAIGLGIINKPQGSRGILNELLEMSTQDDFSPPVLEVFGLESEASPIQFPDGFRVPVSLSRSQLDILFSTTVNQLSLVIGPPGTGKSFTIAALAIEYLSRGKSVLIASKNTQAVNVVADKIEKDFNLNGLVIRAGREGYKRKLNKRVKDILNGIRVKAVSNIDVAGLESKLQKLESQIDQLEAEISQSEEIEVKRGSDLHYTEDKWYFKLHKLLMKYQQSKEKPLWRQMTQLENLRFNRIKVLKELIITSFNFYLYDALRYSRRELLLLQNALKARSGNLQESFFEEVDFKQILSALPIWTSTMADVHDVLPLRKELFDLVIIDEATQCDIASSLPILQRGSSAVIVGDPKQLRHLSFLSRKQQGDLIRKNELRSFNDQKLDYRAVSLLDLASLSIDNQEQIHFLDEHYRSMPDIIHFSNQQFYAGRLKIMTSCPATLDRQHVFLHQVEGERNAKGFNELEANHILQMISEIIEEEKRMEEALCQSIGILSPFRDQVNYLRKAAEQQLKLSAFERHRLLIGTPYDFQGEEKDIMFLSFALDNTAHPSGFMYLNKPDVFNVSLTRARARQHVIISFSPKKLSSKSLAAAYIDSLGTVVYKKDEADIRARSDQFLQEVMECLKKWKIKEHYVAYPIAGVEIDLLAVKDGQSYCIDLVGYPGSFEESLPVDRRLMLERVGLRTFTLPYSMWNLKREESERALAGFLGVKISTKK